MNLQLLYMMEYLTCHLRALPPGTMPPAPAGGTLPGPLPPPVPHLDQGHSLTHLFKNRPAAHPLDKITSSLIAVEEDSHHLPRRRCGGCPPPPPPPLSSPQLPDPLQNILAQGGGGGKKKRPETTDTDGPRAGLTGGRAGSGKSTQPSRFWGWDRGPGNPPSHLASSQP